jgi:hypothetical protein
VRKPPSEPPAWQHVSELVKFVTRAIDNFLNADNDWDKLCAEYGLEKWPFHSEGRTGKLVIPTWVAWVRERERKAVEMAEQGSFAALAELLEPQIFAALAASTRALIKEIVAGRRKRPAHKPKLTESERRARYPIHDAADEVPAVERMLRAWYPQQDARQIHDRALLVIERRHELRAGALANYLKRSKRDRRRLSP